VSPRSESWVAPQTTLTFIVNNRTDAWKTGVNSFFYVKKLSNCPLSLVDASHKFMCLSAYWQWNWANEPARISAVIAKLTIAVTKCNAIVIQSVSRFFGTDLFTDLASPQQGQITSYVPVRSHVNSSWFDASVQSCSLALTANFGAVIFGNRWLNPRHQECSSATENFHNCGPKTNFSGRVAWLMARICG